MSDQDRHVTDEEIHELGGATEQRLPAGVPRATCLRCGNEHVAFYTAQTCNCMIDLKERRPYYDWLEYFRKLALGVLRTPADAKFQMGKVLTGRTMLTFHLQSDLDVHGFELQHDYYKTREWQEAGFLIYGPFLAR